MCSPWANIEKTEPVKLEEIIAEEVAKILQTKQEKRYPVKAGCEEISTAELADVTVTTSEGITSSDSKNELNEEYDQLECVEEQCSSSCVDNCRRLSLNIQSDSEKEEIDDIWDEEDWTTPELACTSGNLFKGSKKLETAEYATIRGGKRSTSKLSSKACNTPAVPLYNKEVRRDKVCRDKKKRLTNRYRLGIDQHAWHLIHEMIKENVIFQVEGISSIDKDSITLRAVQYMQPVYKVQFKFRPILCTIKVFKIDMELDKGFEIACQKADREVANTNSLMWGGISYLPVISHKEHVIVTPSHGTMLKNINWNISYCYKEFNKVRDLMKEFYEVNLIHPNLSENIIQYWSYRYIILNVGQCVDTSHEDAFRFLFKGCSNIVNFFKSRGITDGQMPNPDNLFKYITGYSFLDKLSLSELQKSIKTKKH